MLRLESLNAFYGDSQILHDITMDVGDRARVALLGRNGAGKSTLLKSIMNAGPQVSGSVQWQDLPLGDMPAYQRARAGLCLVPEDRRILPHLSVFENLLIAQSGIAARQRRAAAEDVLSRFPMLQPFKDRNGGVLSGGQQQMLALARAALARPKLLLLDEPTEGLAPIIVEGLVADVLSICQQDCALLLCEQNVWFCRRCTNRVLIIDSGQLVFDGTWTEFETRRDVLTRHLAV